MTISIIKAALVYLDSNGFILRNVSHLTEDMAFTDFEKLLAQLRYDFTGKRDAPR